MKKAIYVYPKEVNREKIDALNYRYSYAEVNGLVKQCRKYPYLNIVDIKAIKRPIKYLYDCINVGARITFHYKWKDKHLFKRELVELLTDNDVVKYYVIE